MDVLKVLREKLKCSEIYESEPMTNHTSFRTGGNADIFIKTGCEEDVISALKIFKESGLEFYIWGRGSNLLVTDKGIRGAAVQLGDSFSGIRIINDTEIYAGAGAPLSAIAALACENSLGGFEFASGIPGSFGGGIFMNAGAYGGEIKDVLVSVRAIDYEGNILLIPAEELELGYRKSNIEKKKLIIIGGVIRLYKEDKNRISEHMAELNEKRRDKQPLNYPSAGSTFKRPEGNFAGKLIEDSGLKGYSVGGAQVSEKHAGFIVNKGGATSGDIIDLINYCIEKVYTDTGIRLEPEVRIVGER